jgi:hypothetical protein
MSADEWDQLKEVVKGRKGCMRIHHAVILDWIHWRQQVLSNQQLLTCPMLPVLYCLLSF